MTQLSQEIIETLRFNEKGLIPAIAQDYLDGAILMMAWVNKTALKETLKTGEIHYWSRSRQKLWHKGETSGHFQKLKSIRYDCDSDAIIFSIEQVGSIACHEGARSCFFKDFGKDSSLGSDKPTFLPPLTNSCSELFQTIKERSNNPQPGSYTNSLLESGENRILKKIGEEGSEFVMACKDNDPKSIANEAADLIFHLQVALRYHNVDWRDVLEVLDSRRNSKRNNSQKK
ncbi:MULTISPECIES: bifunctional phosphoribosyl-AMP cyclohydrolase/phosphoribosyl-ATP diphosphatase HisIE [unclassified Prochlorococcus]|uniref:bifunctional phosphoribosyl-AMP cyclohydrolase/phosphoribosyl-ATP diphosphatase HisIE n=1 Tax=unclassified Prochlorococcus TaxID=2627481 RepID=UPI000533B14C|nr:MULTISPECIES: bifunctional phosphoribosyl-AMP cyclohydrolase/phosphoribosyl-ATP diphosphatase HisIE [unclassified Prochlorococcus]KGG15013.1 Phosphoribosyl-AMP cyclohydrolase [Prochlorococcus sp. MIT 0602]KGG17149.1 Phosphoribosyl-AMP cyclohydrolase [Prochlorococcus sp. MIT 0603]